MITNGFWLLFFLQQFLYTNHNLGPEPGNMAPFKLAANPELKVHGRKPGKKEMAGSDVILLWVQQQRFGIGNALIILTGC
jgi:hypothetical protein